MRKILLTLIAFTTLCTMNVWGATTTWTKGNVTITKSGYTLTIEPVANTDGVMGDYKDFDGSASTSEKRPATWTFDINKIVIKEGVTIIGKYAFQGMTNLHYVHIKSSKLSKIESDAFLGCTGMNKICYDGSPSEWAGITFSNQTAHPFGALTESADYHFYGDEDNRTSTLVLFPPLKDIKPYAFQRAYIDGNGIHIPGTVQTIGTHAFYGVNLTGGLTINRISAPNLGEDAFYFGAKKDLYIRDDADDNGYKTTDWTASGKFKTPTTINVGGTIDTYGAGIKWDLDENGVLTLNAKTENKAISFTGNSAYKQYPWSYFRRLVYKVVLKGGISELSQTLTYCWGLSEVILNQDTIPTCTTDKAKINFNSLFNIRDNVTLKIKSASLADPSVTNLAAEPWSNAKLDIALSDNLVIGDNADYTTLLANCSTYVEKPITLQLNRTLTNAQYNTFCSPIDIPAADITSKFGGADIRALESSILDGNELTLNFSTSSLDAIEAGKPYLIKPSSAVSNPTFTNIDPSSLVSDTTDTETDYVDFKGTLRPVPLAAGQNILFLGADNELLWPAVGSENKIKGMRAYFELKDAARNAVKARITMNPNHTTDIADVQNDKVQSTKVLRNGQIYLMHEGQMYDVHGRRIQ